MAEHAREQGRTTDAQALEEVVRFTSDLIRIDTTNRGGGDCRERPAAEYAAERLAEAGIEPTLLERTEDGPTWSPGSRAPTPAPARCSSTATSTWCRPRPPTGASTRSPGDPGRRRLGPRAVDMKNMDAMILAAVRAGPGRACGPVATW